VADDLEIEGIDIVIALDVSGSMQDTDLQPNRLDAAKMVIQDFVRRRPSDRIGLVVFGREAYTHVPLTLDHGTLLRMLAELRLGIIDGNGTAIGNGIGVALNRLRHSDARSKVIIVLTDGENNSGNISPEQAARFAQTMKVKVYTILAGNNDPEAGGEEPGMGQRHPVNPKLLEQIASMTGGTPYLATDTRALAERFQKILEDLEKSRLHDRGVLYAELYRRFLFVAFALLVVETALRLTRLRRLP
jgi:Ca-activated chloride channel family protein